MLHNQNSSKMNSLPFYLFMPPLECHHPNNLKVLCLSSKQKYLQHLPKTIKETLHAISYSLHTPLLSYSSFLKTSTPFYCGVPRTDFSLWIPWYEQQSSNSLLQYSHPLSDLRNFNLFLVSFSTKAFHFVKVSKHMICVKCN